jgi:hypothetical protein
MKRQSPRPPRLDRSVARSVRDSYEKPLVSGMFQSLRNLNALNGLTTTSQFALGLCSRALARAVLLGSLAPHADRGLLGRNRCRCWPLLRMEVHRQPGPRWEWMRPSASPHGSSVR